MKKWLKNSKKLMAAFGAVVFMLVAGWQFGVSEAEAPFSEKEVALEKAIAGSGSGQWICCQSLSQGCYTVDGWWFEWDYVFFGQFCP